MKRRGLDRVFLHSGLAGLMVAGCSPPGSTDEPDPIRPEVRMTADDCTRGSIGGKVGVCHATGASSNPYVHLEVSTQACINGHANKHEQDFVSSDSSCVRCGDGIVAGGETCDPPSSCPTSCDDGNPCTIDSMSGSPSTCDVTCGHSAVTQCASGDGCCAAGCDANSDGDCAPSCGNGVVESGETCDPPSSCPTGCTDPNPCIPPGVLTGSAADCTAACAFATPHACDDGLESTADICNGDGPCSFAIIPGVTDCGYPYPSSNPLTAVTFNESEVLRAIRPSLDTAGGVVSLLYNDEHAMTLGVRQAVVQGASGSSAVDYPVSPPGASPDQVIDPQTGRSERADGRRERA
jgi:hypothetical protein